MDVRIAVETTFDKGERIIEQIQRAVLCDQVEEITREIRVCPDRASVRAIHDYRTHDLDTGVDKTWGSRCP